MKRNIKKINKLEQNKENMSGKKNLNEHITK